MPFSIIETLKEYRGIPLCFLGLGIDRAWRASIFYFGAFPSIGIADYYVFGSALAVTGLIIALLSSKIPSLHSVKGVFPASCLLMTLGSLCVVLACYIVPFYPLKLFGLVAIGVGDGLLYLLWAEFFGQLDSIKVATYFALALLFGEFFKLVLMGLEPPYHSIIAISFPLISFLCIQKSFAVSPEITIGKLKKKVPLDIRNYPWKPVLLIALCFFIAAFDANQMRPLNIGNALGAILVPLVILIALSANQKLFRIQSLNQILFPLFIAGFLLLLPIDNLSLEFESFRNETAYTMLFMLVLIVLSSVSRHFEINAIALNGMERFVRFLFELSGFLLSTMLADYASPETTSLVYSVFEILLIASIFIIFFTKRGLSAKWDFELQSNSEVTKGFAEAQRYKELAETYNLSPREQEVFVLLLQGYSTAQIAEMLYAALGTIKAHVNHIYGKFNVHSKAELTELLNNIYK